MINISKFEKVILLEIPCQIFYVTNFCLPIELFLIYPTFLVKTKSLDNIDKTL